MSEPLVTAICLTKNRREWLPRAIKCFQNQTYQNLELVIVNDGEDIIDLVPTGENIRLIQTEKPQTIGLKRNFACRSAAGSIIAHWDDDDLSAPERISDQIFRLTESGKAVTGYSTVIFEGPEGRWKYVGAPNVQAVGTSLCYLKTWWAAHQFPDKHIGEDSDFAMAAAQAKQLISVDGGEMIIASIHPGNTSPRQLTGAQWVKM